MVWIALAYAVFFWWFSTGAILFVVSRAGVDGPRGYMRITLLMLPFLGAGVAGVLLSLQQTGVAAAYVAFTSAILIWGWFELAFLTGVITGPNARACPPGVSGFERFRRAWGTIAYSEICLLITLILMVSLAWNAPNTLAMWTFIILFFARISAKLNVYLGVPNINDEFLPAPMRHLTSHFRKAPMNGIFPISVTALAFAMGCWIERAMATTGGTQTGFVLLAALTGLALLEHWLMVVRLPDAALWRWLMPSKEGALNRTLTPEKEST